MTTTITQPVGRCGTNLAEDVITVTQLLQRNGYLNLNRSRATIPGPSNCFSIANQALNDPRISRLVGSIVGPSSAFGHDDLIAAIALFQIRVLKHPSPTGTVDPCSETLGKLVNPGSGPYFPLTQVPSNYSASNQHRAGWARGSGSRTHAGFDLYGQAGTPIIAVADGTVVADPRAFYKGTWQLSIFHPSLGLTLRYGEIKKGSTGQLKSGSKVLAGTRIAEIGKLTGHSQNMLHLEIYNGNVSPVRTSAANSAKWKIIGGTNAGQTKSTGRLTSLVQPKPFLDKWKGNLPSDYCS